MSADDQFTRGTVNEALSRGDDMARFSVVAAGFTPNDLGEFLVAGQLGDYNGGIYSRRVSRLEKGDLLFRFSDSKYKTMETKFSGGWWIDRECFATIRMVARRENSSFADTARSYLGVFGDKNDMKNLVGGVLAADFWCFKGLTGGVKSENLNISGPLRTDVMQIYVPGGLKLENFSQPRDDIFTSGII